jgi:ABC-2 type transport system permease protein
MLKIYQRLWQVNWAEQWQYRANLLMYLLYWLVSPIVYMAVWTTIANANGTVNGLSANDFVTYYMTLLVVDQLTSNIVIHIFAYKIQDGTLSGELIRPIHPMLVNTLTVNTANKVLNFLVFLPIWGVFFFLFRPDYAAVTWQNVLMALPMISLGFLIGFLLSAAITCIAFWTTRVWAIHEFYFGVLVLFSGQFVPLSLMPTLVQQIAQYLPFQFFLYFPIQMVLGKLSPDQILWGYIQAVFWLLLSFLLFNWVWRTGVKKFSAVGA